MEFDKFFLFTMKRIAYLILTLILVIDFYGITGIAQAEEKMYLKSPAFKHGGFIPPKYTCDGENVSPPLEWGNVPAKTKSFVLICDDPDAPRGTWVHWILYNIPSNVRTLAENVPALSVLPATGARHGTNSWSRIGYGGPCPPGGTHRYFFKLYAIDAILDLSPGATKNDVIQAIKGRVLSEAILMGKYSRQK